MGTVEALVMVLYLFVMGYLGWQGFRRTKTAADYMLAGREAHPFVMALSYGATFISTSAIVGFGGVAAELGMGLLWLVFLNIAVGIFLAFVVLGGPTRRLGHQLDAHTFPELLGKRFESRFIQVFAGCVIFVFMPLYATAVLLGGAEFIHTFFHVPFPAAVLILALVMGGYVMAGGLKGVMYSDALQGSIMACGMLILLVLTYWQLGGPFEAHSRLTEMSALVPERLQAAGHTGWTSMPEFGWGDARYNLWWMMVSTLSLGVGIGVLAQPQMAVRFMTVKSKRELNRAVAVGGVFILLLPGVAYTVGALSNVYFNDHEEIRGAIIRLDEEKRELAIVPEGRLERGASPESEARVVPIGPRTEIIRGEDGAPDIVRPRQIAIARTGGNRDMIISTYIDRALPRWFGVVFLLTLVSAAMSTLSSQFHAMGTAIGRDVFQQLSPRTHTDRTGILVTRLGIMAGLTISLLAAGVLRNYIAIATALFFGLCASTFLPAYIGGLFWKDMTRQGAVASMVGGAAMSLFWMAFFYGRTAGAIGLCRLLTGRNVLLEAPNWPAVDPLLIALPFSAALAIGVSLATRKPRIAEAAPAASAEPAAAPK